MRSSNLPFKISTLLISFILLFSSQSIFAQSGWSLLSKSSDFQCVNYNTQNKLTAYADNYYRQSNNGGQNWSILKSLPYRLYGTVSWLDSLYGYSIGVMNNAQTVIKTTDGGLSWFPLNLSSYPITALSVNFIDRNTGWTGGTRAYGEGQIMKTTNGGLNWTVQNLTFNNVNSICIVNYNKVFLTTTWFDQTDSVALTTNGGENWTKIKIASNHECRKIIFKDSLNGWSCGYNSDFRRTTDGGNSWVHHDVGFGNNTNMFFLNINTGWISLSSAKTFKTTNGGINWYQKNVPLYVDDINFINDNTGCVVGYQGKIAVSTDGGENWTLKVNPPVSLTAMNFLNINTGYFLSNLESNTILWKTESQGIQWNPSKTFYNHYLNDLKLVNSQKAITCGNNGEIFRTTNSGDTWDSTFLNAKLLNSVFLLNENCYWTCGDSGKIFKTTNSGFTWIDNSLSTFDKLNRIYFSDSLHGYVGSFYGKYFYTTNAGTSWLQKTVHASAGISDIKFLNSNTGFLAGNFLSTIGFNVFHNSIILKTTNGGDNWNLSRSINYLGPMYYNTLDIIDNTEWMTWTNGISKSIDEGSYWSDESLPIITNIISICNVSSDKTYAGSAEGTIFANFNPTSIRQLNQGILTNNFSLHQNYPNPFNPATKINFDLKNSAFAMLRIYDITGREVKTLVNEKLSAGSYSYDFNASELPSGVYFYQLQTDEFVETKKMILLK